MRRVVTGIILSLSLCVGAYCRSQAATEARTLATVNGEAITESDVRIAAATQLDLIDVKRLQAETGYAREHQEIYESAVSSLVEKKLVELAADENGVSPEGFVRSEVERRAKSPTENEITAIWNKNKDLAKVAEDDGRREIRSGLMQRAKIAAYHELIQELRERYAVQMFLEPLRTSVNTADFPVKGPAQAPVTIVEFSDFQCPFCAKLFPTLNDIVKQYGDKVRIVYRQFPLSNLHSHAEKAAEASLCANDQGKFWEMHDAMFKHNESLDIDAVKHLASETGIETTAFNSCLDSAKYAERVSKDVRDGIQLGVVSTPTVFINGRYLNGAHPYDDIAKVIDEELQIASKKHN